MAYREHNPPEIYYKLGYYEGQSQAYERMLVKLGAIASRAEMRKDETIILRWRTTDGTN